MFAFHFHSGPKHVHSMGVAAPPPAEWGARKQANRQIGLNFADSDSTRPPSRAPIQVSRGAIPENPTGSGTGKECGGVRRSGSDCEVVRGTANECHLPTVARISITTRSSQLRTQWNETNRLDLSCIRSQLHHWELAAASELIAWIISHRLGVSPTRHLENDKKVIRARDGRNGLLTGREELIFVTSSCQSESRKLIRGASD